LKFTSLWHHVYDVDRLRQAYLALTRDASAGIDGHGHRAVRRRLRGRLPTPIGRRGVPGRAAGKVPHLQPGELHAEKTRILEFGRFAAQRREERGQGKPETFNFLGFTHACDKTRDGRFIVLRRTMAVRMRAKLRFIKQELRKRLHEPVAKVGAWLKAVLSGYYRYFGVPRNNEALNRLRVVVYWLWRRSLGRRSQKGRLNLARYNPLAARWLPVPRVCQPYPEQRLRVMIRGKSPVR
jgi:hypothetical protein